MARMQYNFADYFIRGYEEGQKRKQRQEEIARQEAYRDRQLGLLQQKTRLGLEEKYTSSPKSDYAIEGFEETGVRSGDRGEIAPTGRYNFPKGAILGSKYTDLLGEEAADEVYVPREEAAENPYEGKLWKEGRYDEKTGEWVPNEEYYENERELREISNRTKPQKEDKPNLGRMRGKIAEGLAVLPQLQGDAKDAQEAVLKNYAEDLIENGGLMDAAQIANRMGGLTPDAIKQINKQREGKLSPGDIADLKLYFKVNPPDSSGRPRPISPRDIKTRYKTDYDYLKSTFPNMSEDAIIEEIKKANKE